MHCGSNYWTVASLGTGAAALTTLLLAVATEHWLYTVEKCTYHTPIEIGNTTEIWTLNLTVRSRAGLWKICVIPDIGEISCVDVGLSHGLQKGAREDDQWTTGAVIEATRIQFPLPVAAVVLTLSGFIISMFGNYRKDKKVIIAAVMYILSGMCLSIGVILYISSINDELSHRSSEKNCHHFKYSYGWSFFLIGISFFMAETSAVISIKLYLNRNAENVEDMVKIIPGLEEHLYSSTNKPLERSMTTLIW